MTRHTFPVIALGALVLASCALNEPGMRHAKREEGMGGRALFLKNCAHCHGADARGDEGPDLHKLDWTDEQITARILNGKKGQMTAFAGKLSSDKIREIQEYLRMLR